MKRLAILFSILVCLNAWAEQAPISSRVYDGYGLPIGSVNGALKMTTLNATTWYSAGSCSSTLTVNWSNGPHQKVTATGNCTLTMTNPTNGEWHALELIQGGSGNYTWTFPATYKWQGGTAPTTSTAVGAVDIVTDGYDGSVYMANFGGNYQ